MINDKRKMVAFFSQYFTMSAEKRQRSTSSMPTIFNPNVRICVHRKLRTEDRCCYAKILNKILCPLLLPLLLLPSSSSSLLRVFFLFICLKFIFYTIFLLRIVFFSRLMRTFACSICFYETVYSHYCDHFCHLL